MKKAQPGTSSDIKKIRREKIRDGEDQKGRESEERRCRHAKKGRKVPKCYVFPMICGSGGSKSRLAIVAGAETSGQMRNEKVDAVVVRSTF